jgi:glycine cleavage system transcriptional repressor
VLFEHGGNIEDSRMAILGGHFAMMLIVALPDGSEPSSLEASLAAPARELDLIVAVRPVAEAPAGHAAGSGYVVSVYGADRPGIVFRVSEALAARGANITDLVTRVVEGDPAVYVMLMEVTIPSDVDAGAVDRDLKTIAQELAVDVAFHPLEEETL